MPVGHHPRTLYRFIDHGELPAHLRGSSDCVITEVEAFIARSRIQPGELEHLYAQPAGRSDDES